MILLVRVLSMKTLNDGKIKGKNIKLSLLQAKHCEVIWMNPDLCEGIEVDNQWCRAFLFNFKDKVWYSIGLVANFHSCIHAIIKENTHSHLRQATS